MLLWELNRAVPFVNGEGLDRKGISDQDRVRHQNRVRHQGTDWHVDMERHQGIESHQDLECHQVMQRHQRTYFYMINHKMTFLSVQSLHWAHPSQLGSVLQYSHFSQRLSRNPPCSRRHIIKLTYFNLKIQRRVSWCLVCQQIWKAILTEWFLKSIKVCSLFPN